jgi:hypothetical protein
LASACATLMTAATLLDQRHEAKVQAMEYHYESAHP